MAIWKADIDSAFRRLPLKPEHRDLAWAVWRMDKTHMAVAKHFSMPFGAIASVHYWDRIGLWFCSALSLVSRVLACGHRRTTYMYCEKGSAPAGIEVCGRFFSVSRAGTAKFAMDVFARCGRCSILW